MGPRSLAGVTKGVCLRTYGSTRPNFENDGARSCLRGQFRALRACKRLEARQSVIMITGNPNGIAIHENTVGSFKVLKAAGGIGFIVLDMRQPNGMRGISDINQSQATLQASGDAGNVALQGDSSGSVRYIRPLPANDLGLKPGIGRIADVDDSQGLFVMRSQKSVGAFRPNP